MPLASCIHVQSVAVIPNYEHSAPDQALVPVLKGLRNKKKGQPCVTSSRKIILTFQKVPRILIARHGQQVVAHQALLLPVPHCPDSSFGTMRFSLRSHQISRLGTTQIQPVGKVTSQLVESQESFWRDLPSKRPQSSEQVAPSQGG